MDTPASTLLGFVVFPLWIASGFLDWTCHRRTGIAVTSGLKENALHWLLLLEGLAGVAAVVLLRIDAAVLLFLLVLFLAHEATVLWDLNASTLVRDVDPMEQMVHSFQELLPLAAIGLLAIDAWPQVLALVGRGDEPADWSVRLKEVQVTPLLIAAAAAVVLLNLLPLFEEALACLRARRGPARHPERRAHPRVEPQLDPVPGAQVRARTPESPEPR